MYFSVDVHSHRRMRATAAPRPRGLYSIRPHCCAGLTRYRYCFRLRYRYRYRQRTTSLHIYIRPRCQTAPTNNDGHNVIPTEMDDSLLLSIFTAYLPGTHYTPKYIAEKCSHSPASLSLPPSTLRHSIYACIDTYGNLHVCVCILRCDIPYIYFVYVCVSYFCLCRLHVRDVELRGRWPVQPRRRLAVDNEAAPTSSSSSSSSSATGSHGSASSARKQAPGRSVFPAVEEDGIRMDVRVDEFSSESVGEHFK